MLQSYPHPSRRTVVYGQNGMVATSHYLAAEAGRSILKKGGNAIDAAIATAAALTVVEPTSNGLGGDCFAIVLYDGHLHGLNASGYAPRNLSIKTLKQKTGGAITPHGFESVTVPGEIGGWTSLREKFAFLDLKTLLSPAIDLAEHGFPIAPTVAYHWNNAATIYKDRLDKPYHNHWFSTFSNDGHSPEEGSIWTLKDHAKTLKEIAKTDGHSFYEGELAKRMISFSNENGGYFSLEDFRHFRPQWVDPVGIDYHGHRVFELPPNCQGAVTSMALNVIKHLDTNDQSLSNRTHQHIEAMKIAFADATEHFADPDYMNVSLAELLNNDYGRVRAQEITDTARVYRAKKPSKSGTVFLTTADKDGNMVSFIQSNYMGFGSGLVVPDTGIALNNRGMNFSTNPKHINCVEPHKRPYHTIMPGFLYKDGIPLGPFGVMGGFMQPQGHLQVLSQLIDLHMNPQQALDAPRWYWKEKKTIEVENDFSDMLFDTLKQKGHTMHKTNQTALFGRGQIILKNPETGIYAGGTDKRADGAVLVP